MRTLLIVLLGLSSSFLGLGQCIINGPSKIYVYDDGGNNRFNYSIDALGKCSLCYHWNISSPNRWDKINGSDSYRQIDFVANNSYNPRTATLTANYFNEDGCMSCTKEVEIIGCGSSNHNLDNSTFYCENYRSGSGIINLGIHYSQLSIIDKIYWKLSSKHGVSFESGQLKGYSSGFTDGPFSLNYSPGSFKTYLDCSYVTIEATIYYKNGCPSSTVKRTLYASSGGPSPILRNNINVEIFPNPSNDHNVRMNISSNQPISSNLKITFLNIKTGEKLDQIIYNDFTNPININLDSYRHLSIVKILVEIDERVIKSENIIIE